VGLAATWNSFLLSRQAPSQLSFNENSLSEFFSYGFEQVTVLI
jgi:hypothetical protein